MNQNMNMKSQYASISYNWSGIPLLFQYLNIFWLLLKFIHHG